MIGLENKKYRIELLYELRLWERNNLPISKTIAGYHLLLHMSKSILQENEEIRLKNIYHSLPFSEKTLRLLLRELEGDGWIEMPSKSKDPRYKEIIPTPKLDAILKLWDLQVDLLFAQSQNRIHSPHPNSQLF